MIHAFCGNAGMDRVGQLEFLRSKYIQFSRQYIEQLRKGKTTQELKDIADVIKVIITEMEILENMEEDPPATKAKLD